MVHLASDDDFDLRKLLPAPTNTEEDAGPYITMGLCYASDPQTGESDITIHRLCVQSRDELSMWLTPGRHIDAFRMKAEAADSRCRSRLVSAWTRLSKSPPALNRRPPRWALMS